MNKRHLKIRQLRVNAVRKALKRIDLDGKDLHRLCLKFEWNAAEEFAIRNSYILGTNDYADCRRYATYGDKAILALYKAVVKNDKSGHGINFFLLSNRQVLREFLYGEWIGSQESTIGSMFRVNALSDDGPRTEMKFKTITTLQAVKRLHGIERHLLKNTVTSMTSPLTVKEMNFNLSAVRSGMWHALNELTELDRENLRIQAEVA